MLPRRAQGRQTALSGLFVVPLPDPARLHEGKNQDGILILLKAVEPTQPPCSRDMKQLTQFVFYTTAH